MAGDWMKIEHALPDKPEVMEMAEALQIDPDAVVGKLVRVWRWYDNHTEDGNAPVTVRALLNRIAGVTNFVTAMINVGWMTEENNRLILGKFNRHNGKTAKVRALGRTRTQTSRSKSNAASVTDALPEKRERRGNSPSENSPLPPKGEKLFSGEGIDLVLIVEAYPRRQDIAAALDHLRASVRKGANPDVVLAGTRAIAAVISQLPSGAMNAYVPSASTFFRNERWRDDPQTWLRAGATKNGGARKPLDLGGRKVGEVIY